MQVSANLNHRSSALIHLLRPRKLVSAEAVRLALQTEHVVREQGLLPAQLQQGFQRLRLRVNVILDA